MRTAYVSIDSDSINRTRTWRFSSHACCQCTVLPYHSGVELQSSCRCAPYPIEHQEQGSLHRLGMPQPMHRNKRERLSVLIRSKVLHKCSVQLAVRRSRCSDGARFAKVNEMETGSKVPFVFGVCKCRTAADTGSARQQRAGTILMQICSLQHAN